MYPNDLIRLLDQYTDKIRRISILQYFKLEIKTHKIELPVQINKNYELEDIAPLVSLNNKGKYVIISGNSHRIDHLQIVKTIEGVVKSIKSNWVFLKIINNQVPKNTKKENISITFVNNYIYYYQCARGVTINMKIYGVDKEKYKKILRKLKINQQKYIKIFR